MMSESKYLVSEFNFVGKLLDFTIKDGYRVKYLKIATTESEHWIKLSKQIGFNLGEAIKPGVWLELSGIKKESYQKDRVKLKAETVKLINNNYYHYQSLSQPVLTNKPNQSKASILVCGKSTCWKRGGEKVCQLIEENLRDRGLSDSVKIKTTGCLKQCKKGPNIVIMPDKARYCEVKPNQVPQLIEKHLVF
ncbi:MAG: (2Fe-2S) ferredoxin domain-containing protein [Xenococcaceae cyanobacterium]